ncbi:Asp23/Gls24 family envelope stress response protein [Tetragenococcus koreensis]|uniref:Stress response regulator gls24 homolog n=1 Tax=Tetragenococcus halophilus TaxID=51669 RepID=A0AB37D3T8_TETHA|nr:MULTISPECIES: Asp23/Gls24 family envelope stress response protein [Tetragenococcus]MDN6835983.1 Asp23/Gls24 family envelope stress response protein [Lactococcus lactis]MCF1586466.1 Asp23/Gls24 family envelope stress response protein [Tetragenococcus koreensis]MCF1616022.1 Asp23/Gls24 family envelope stress response protein [Tetragenococcus koreensis]MCF1620876.1 Asp23/Gls24 family envelope stress response protein [Tetragenococcus koreensis]MCF1625802.1 Asp23/Gls24 family envelope stress res
MADQKSTTGVNAQKGQEQVSGELTFEDKVIQKIIGIALEKVDGLLQVDGGFFSNMAERISNSDNVTNGIDTEVGKEQVAVDLDVVIEYRKDAENIYEQIKKVSAEQVKKMTHLDVVEVNVHVEDIKTKEEIEEDKKTDEQQSDQTNSESNN